MKKEQKNNAKTTKRKKNNIMTSKAIIDIIFFKTKYKKEFNLGCPHSTSARYMSNSGLVRLIKLIVKQLENKLCTANC
jgi:hypothetical protein